MINSVFTSFLVRSSQVFALDYHLERLEQNVQTVFGKSIDKEAVRELIKAELPLNATLRVVVNGGLSYQVEIRPTTSSKNLRCLTMEYSKQSPKIKSADLAESLRHRKFAQDSGFDDLIWTKNNYITEGVFWNIYFWDGKNLFTPDENILPGICRRIFLENNLCKEAKIALDDLDKFSSVFYTNSSLLVGEITEIGSKSFQPHPELKDKLLNTLETYMDELD